MPSFKIETKTHLPTSQLGKRLRFSTTNEVFTITLNDEVRLRFRPQWDSNGVGASMTVLRDNAVWDCARYVEMDEVKHLGDQWYDTLSAEFLWKPPAGEHTPEELRALCLKHNEELAGYKAVPSDVIWSSAFDIRSFWAYLGQHASTAATIKDIQLMGFELKDDARATLELYAVVHLAKGFLYAQMPESEQHVSMRMELVLIA